MKSELIIDNQTVAAKSGATFNRVHPDSGEVVTSAAAASFASSESLTSFSLAM